MGCFVVVVVAVVVAVVVVLVGVEVGVGLLMRQQAGFGLLLGWDFGCDFVDVAVGGGCSRLL